MNNLRRTCAVTILTLLLAVFASAGQIQCPGATPPPPPSGPSLASVTTSAILTIIGLIR